MDIVGIERESFDSFKKKLKQLVSLIPEQPLTNVQTIEEEWIEGKQLAVSLNISLRKLQSLRESGKLSFSTIGKKIYYRTPEVKSLFQSKTNSK